MALPGRGCSPWHGVGIAAARRRGQKGTGHRMVSCPLLTPQPFLRTRLPSVARLNARGPQGRLVPQGSTLDGSGAFRSGTPPPCTEWPRTVMRGALRKVNSGHNSIPKSARRPEPSPRTPVSPRNRRASRRKGGFGGVKRGKGNHTVPFSPFAPVGGRRQSPAAGRRQFSPTVSAASS